ncbi:hypothetical protein CQJ94_05170 [Glycomyces fuscus]|nr:hypothetical protein CQJ94_05170 [Glycomyces fuscus]
MGNPGAEPRSGGASPAAGGPEGADTASVLVAAEDGNPLSLAAEDAGGPRAGSPAGPPCSPRALPPSRHTCGAPAADGVGSPPCRVPPTTEQWAGRWVWRHLDIRERTVSTHTANRF